MQQDAINRAASFLAPGLTFSRFTQVCMIRACLQGTCFRQANRNGPTIEQLTV
jgi:hypothetical protein